MARPILVEWVGEMHIVDGAQCALSAIDTGACALLKNIPFL